MSLTFAADAGMPVRSPDLSKWNALGLTQDESGNPRKPLSAKDIAKLQRAKWTVNTPEFAIRVLEMRGAGVSTREIAKATGKTTRQVEVIYIVGREHHIHVPAPSTKKARDMTPIRADIATFEPKWAEMRDNGLSSAIARTTLGLSVREANRLEGKYAQRGGGPREIVDLAACAHYHAKACMKAGGFWAFSTNPKARREPAICRPMIPPTVSA